LRRLRRKSQNQKQQCGKPEKASENNPFNDEEKAEISNYG
jgi:hypothetical protein